MTKNNTTKPAAKKVISEAERIKRQLGAEAARTERARIEEIKAEVLKFEKTNVNRIVLWRCTGTFWKMGGNSALIYKERIAKRLKMTRLPRLVNDTDFFSKFKTGVISIRDINALEKRLKQLKIYPVIWQKDYVSFDLGYSLSEAEINALKKLDRTRREQINQIIAPKVTYPDVYSKLKIVQVDIYYMVSGMDHIGRELVGGSMVQKMRFVMNRYFLMTNGEIAEKEGLTQMYEGVCDLIYRLGEILELGLAETTRALRIGQHLSAIKILINNKKEKINNE